MWVCCSMYDNKMKWCLKLKFLHNKKSSQCIQLKMLLLVICESPSERDKIRHIIAHNHTHAYDRMINARRIWFFVNFAYTITYFSCIFFLSLFVFSIVVIHCFWLFSLIKPLSDHFSFEHFSFYVLFILIVAVRFAFICLFVLHVLRVHNHLFVVVRNYLYILHTYYIHNEMERA